MNTPWSGTGAAAWLLALALTHTLGPGAATTAHIRNSNRAAAGMVVRAVRRGAGASGMMTGDHGRHRHLVSTERHNEMDPVAAHEARPRRGSSPLS